MIENNFAQSDTLTERVKKLSEQTGIEFVLCYDTGVLAPLYSLQYLRTRTGSMAAFELMDWIATFALGFRTAVNQDGPFLQHLRNQSVARAKHDFKTYENAGVLYFTSALAGEAGELVEALQLSDAVHGVNVSIGRLCNLIKKVERHKVGGPDVGNSIKVEDINTAKLKEEIGGTLIYLDLVASFYGIDLEDAITETFNRVSDKIGSEYRL